MNAFSHVPPGFRFHPTDEELVDYYLRKKITSRGVDLDVIKDVDLYRIEPWDLQGLCKVGSEDQNEWFFFSHKDKKYPTGTRTNRATTAGFWKATGRDKSIYSKHDLIGMRKTLVFYKGRAPNGQKSDYIMHEYRLETDENGTPQEEGWVICRVFKKKLPSIRKICEHESPIWYDDQVSFMPEMDSPKRQTHHNLTYNKNLYSFKKELDIPEPYHIKEDHFLQLPLLETTTKAPPITMPFSSIPPFGLSGPLPASIFLLEDNHQSLSNIDEHAVDPVTDWRILDKFVASQLSQEDVSGGNECANGENSLSHP